jgi:DNA-binding NarL/FixJ family response regulator
MAWDGCAVVSAQDDRMITVLLVDDQSIVRQGLRMQLALEPDLKVIGEAENGEEALELAKRMHPNVILMDIELQLMDGITATARLRAATSESAVVILSLYDDARTREKALAAGAVAFVSKQEPSEALLAAIRQAAAHPTGC